MGVRGRGARPCALTKAAAARKSDGREVIISLEDPATAEATVTSLVIEHHALAEACEMLFEKVWAAAAPFKLGGDKIGGSGTENKP
ncbi:MAG TPA: hypothetical protein VMW93_08145 [bacterium]|nr:hypothetical protein [bacterium]